MSRFKYKKEGKRVNLWIPAEQMKMAKEIDNLSNFLQIALDNATDIMAWAILKGIDPKKYHVEHRKSDAEILQEFNEKHPPNALTAKRLNKEWHSTSPKLPEILF